MSDGSAEAPLWMPDLGDMPAGPARILIWLVVWRDGRGSCDPTNAELCKVTKLDESTVRKHTGWLANEGWAKRERRRREDGSLGGWRYWLDLEKLGLAGGTSTKSALPVGSVSPVENAAEAPPQNPPSPPEGRAGSRAENLQVPPPAEGGKSAGLIKPGACARADFPFPSSSYFLSFPWRDEDTKAKAADILSVCELGLGRLDQQNDRVLISLAYVLDEGLWSGFDWDLDVKPTVKRKTAPGGRVLWDFALITSNIETAQARRLKAAERAAPSKKPKGGFGSWRGSPAPADVATKRARRIEALRNAIETYDRGLQSGQDGELLNLRFELPHNDRHLSGEWLADALRPIIERYRAELAALEAEGAGNGEA